MLPMPRPTGSGTRRRFILDEDVRFGYSSLVITLIPFLLYGYFKAGLLSKAVDAHLLPKRELSVGAVEPWRGCDGITAV